VLASASFGNHMRLAGKAIIVTGSTTGVGEAIARRCVTEGANVLIHGLERDLGEKLVTELGASTRLVIDDLADADAPGRIIAAAMGAFGRIDAIVNNAAWIVRSNITSTSATTFDRAMAINVRAPLLLIQAGLAELKKSQGCVLNIGSVNAYCGEANQLDYSMTKGALMTMTRNLSDALGRDHVRVNQLNLGWVLSENERKLKIKEGMAPDWHEHPPLAFAPSGRLILPNEVAAGAVYWLSDESRPISGSVVDFAQHPVIGRNPVKS
jgi:NAD(P)-dependent dehydrogenase (short-subunit alcohol dehydrogenase family)